MDAAKFYVRTRIVFMEIDMESKLVQMVATIAARFIGKTINFLVLPSSRTSYPSRTWGFTGLYLRPQY